jgi:DNA-binding GntR family transcriptional regulator
VSPELHRPLPPYLQIVEHYRSKIMSGELKDGDRLPSTRQIIEQWDVAHATAAKALATLRSEGLVETTAGGAGGTVVKARDVGYTPRDRMIAVRRRGRIYPPGSFARIIAAELVTEPSAAILDSLGLQAGAAAIRRHRVTFQGDTPLSVSTSWFSGELASVAPALLGLERITQGTPGYIEQQAGRRIAEGLDKLRVDFADADLAAELGVAEGSPVLAGRNWIRDSDGQVIEYGEYFSLPSHEVAYDYAVGD